MYLDHFRLNQEPFSIAPDPSFLYLSEGHNEALAHLHYGFSHGGFVLITGEVGTGKTTLLRNLVNTTPDELDVVFILNPRLTAKELLESVCDELAIPHDKMATQTIKQFIDILNRHLLKVHREGRSTVLIIDEAQNLSPAVLEQIRLLTNLETDEKKLLRIILIGQPELDDMLAQHELRQLAQRITARYHLRALKGDETSAYIAHRLATAGGSPDIFPPQTARKLFKVTGGIPRLINTIADRAMLGAYARSEFRVTPAMVQQAAGELLPKRRQINLWPWIATALAVVLATLGLWLWVGNDEGVDATGQSSGTAPPIQNPPDQPPSEALSRPAATGTITKEQRSTFRNAEPANRTPDTESAPAPSRQPQAATETPRQAAAPTQPAQPAPTASRDIARPAGSTYLAHRLAFVHLFDAWDIEYDPAGRFVPCDFAPQHKLLCTTRRGEWTEISHTGLPVVLELWDDGPTPYYAALLKINGTELTVGIGNDVFTTTQKALRKLWFGNFTMMWPMPVAYRSNLTQGDRHRSVSNVRQALERAMNESIPADDPLLFDEPLAAALERYQNRQGITIDGIVGPRTWVALARGRNVQMPSLSEGS